MRWPRVLTPNRLVELIRNQKSPRGAIRIFDAAPLRYPSYRHTSAVYSAVLRSISTSPSPATFLADIDAILHQMILGSSAARDAVFSQAIDIYARLDLPGTALSLFRAIPLSNCSSWPLSFLSILRLFLSRGDLRAAHQVFDESSHRPEAAIGLESLNLVIETLCRLRRHDLAAEVFGEIKELSCFPDRATYRSLMRGLCDGDRLEDATHLLYSMLWRISQKGCDADVVVYRTILEALCAKGKIKAAEDVLEKVLKKGLRSPRRRRAFEKPRLVGACPEDDRKLIDEALVSGGVRSAATYKAVIMDLYEEGEVCHADKLFDEMLAKGFKPSAAMYDAKITALCREGRGDDAARVLDEEMVRSGCGATGETYRLVMEGLCREGKATRASGYLAEMGRRVGCVAKKETYELLVTTLCGEGRFAEAARVLEKMVSRRHWLGSPVYCTLIREFCSVGRSYDAVSWLEEMVRQGQLPDAAVWDSLVSTVCHEPAEFSDLLTT